MGASVYREIVASAGPSARSGEPEAGGRSRSSRQEQEAEKQRGERNRCSWSELASLLLLPPAARSSALPALPLHGAFFRSIDLRLGNLGNFTE